MVRVTATVTEGVGLLIFLFVPRGERCLGLLLHVFAIWCTCLASSEKQITEQGTASLAIGTPQGSSDDSAPSRPSPKDRLAPRPCLSGAEARVCENDTLPLLVVVAGVEGSGHHLVQTLFSRLTSFILPANDLPCDADELDPNHKWNKVYASIPEEEQYYEDRFRETKQLLESAKKQNKLGAMVFTTSSPLADRLFTAASPDDLVDLKNFECKL